MNIFKNVIGVIAGVIIGSLINSGIIELGPHIIDTPEGFDNSDLETLAATIYLLEPVNYIPVFLAHALGTLVGAFLVAKIAITKNKIFAFAIGGWFLLGGIAAVFMFPSPTWIIAVDLIGAYIPMAFIGWKLAGAKN